MELRRFVATHVWIGDLFDGEHIQSAEGPSHILLTDGTQVSRVHTVGICVSNVDNLMIDDGTGAILVRFFEEGAPSIDIGTPVRVIGRARAFEGQTYLVGEIVKTIDQQWIEVWKKATPKREAKQEATVSTAPQPKPADDAVALVRKMDTGEGADYQEVVAALGNSGEDTIIHLLAMGELFETRPGKLKVLE